VRSPSDNYGGPEEEANRLFRKIRGPHLGSDAGRPRSKGVVKYSKSTLRGGAKNFGPKKG